MPDPEKPSLAELIADGIEVDWNREASSGRFSIEELQRFQPIERVFQTHRRLLFKESPESLTWGLDVSTQAIAHPNALPVSGHKAAPGTTWGHLEIREHVDGGGFGDVYRAFDTVLEMEVALKLMRDKGHAPSDNMRRFLAEARRLARVRHENVVILHGADVRDGRMGMWTDFLQGTTLEVQLSIQGPMSAREAALVGIDLCRALAAVHGVGLVHRDVKTSNVMRTEGGRIVLFDFGLAAADRRVNPNEPLASLGGTPLYMAP
ncbi:MAG TPA: serine/threonine-protein kinase, partial [Candidatus Eisenbacteria bacterium]|nr:serine/threonine-protein kinase [Candidatus Eisenbacteria bacterium]